VNVQLYHFTFFLLLCT